MRALSRLVRDARREGPLRLAAEHARRRWNRAVDDRIVVWEWRPGVGGRRVGGSEPAADGLRLDRYGGPEEVPDAFFEAAEAEEGPNALRRVRAEFADAGVLWVPRLAGRPAGYQWTRRGDLVVPWHVPLGPETTLIFSVVTFRPYRGRGVARRAMFEICRREVPTDGRAVGESFVWNRASVRMFEKAGFRRLSEHRPYPGYPD